MKVLSKASVYGIRALLYITAQQSDEEYVRIQEMSQELDISFHFLTKILQVLTQKGILRSYRGPNGGIALDVPPEEVFLYEIVCILEGDGIFTSCLLGLEGCGDFDPCPVHDFWENTRTQLQDEFSTTSLAALGSRINAERLRLSG